MLISLLLFMKMGGFMRCKRTFEHLFEETVGLIADVAVGFVGVWILILMEFFNFAKSD